MMQSLSVHPFYCKLVSSLSPVCPLTLLRPLLALPTHISHHTTTSHTYTHTTIPALTPSPPLTPTLTHTHLHITAPTLTPHTLSHYHTLSHHHIMLMPLHPHSHYNTSLSHSFTLTSTCILRCVLKEDRSTVKMDRESSKTAGTADVPFLDRERQS